MHVADEIKDSGWERQPQGRRTRRRLLSGMTEIAEQVFDAPVRIGFPERDRFGGLVEDIQSPAWAAAGLSVIRIARRRARCARHEQAWFHRKVDTSCQSFEIVLVVFFDKLLYALAPVAQDIVRNIWTPMAELPNIEEGLEAFPFWERGNDYGTGRS